jgi:hypothetical protein
MYYFLRFRLEGPLQYCLPTDTEIPDQFPTKNTVVCLEAWVYKENRTGEKAALFGLSVGRDVHLHGTLVLL